MGKDDRLNLRMKPRLKSWFKKYAARRGGMSKLVVEHVEELKQSEEVQKDGEERTTE